MKLFVLLTLAFSVSCGSIQFDPNGVGRDQYISENKDGCNSDVECGEGKVCAPVKGEFPGSCARTGDGPAVLGALAIGALAVGAAATGGEGSSGPTPASNYPQNNYQGQQYRQDFRGCCSYHGGIDYCSYGILFCKDGWRSGCGC